MRTSTDRDGITWLADKRGAPIKYGQRLLGDDGEYYEIVGTGMAVPGCGDVTMFWTSDHRAVWRSTQTMECVTSDLSPAIIGGCIILAIVALIALIS